MTSDQQPRQPEIGSGAETSDLLRRAIDRRSLLALAAGAAGGLVLAACGGGGNNGSSGSTATTTAADSGAAADTGATAATGAANRGGTLRVAVQGGGQAETLNPLAAVYDQASTLRARQLFDWIVRTGPDLDIQMRLAEAIEPGDGGREWTVRLRSGVEWHDGTPLTADDLIYTLRYIANPDTASAAVSAVSQMDTAAIEKLDDLTVRIPMTAAIGDLPSLLSINGLAVIKNDTTDFTQPIGTGPFKFESWTPGQNSVFARNPNYWVEGEPYVDSLQVLAVDDHTARLNALLTDQVDAISTVQFPQAKDYLGQGDDSPITILVGDGPNLATFTQGLNHPPFDDVRVRQAMRLIVNRAQMVEQVQLGFGAVANDLYSPGYPFYDSELPQREQDIEQAKSLLKQAGYEDLSVELSSTAGTGGKLEAATLLAEQAKAAGVDIKVLSLPPATYFSSVFPNYAFAQVNWEPGPIAINYLQKSLPGAPYNACQWDDPETTRLIKSAVAESDRAKAEQLWLELQQIMWERGAEIVWGTSPTVDGVSKKLVGVTPSKAAVLNSYNFNTWSFA